MCFKLLSQRKITPVVDFIICISMVVVVLLELAYAALIFVSEIWTRWIIHYAKERNIFCWLLIKQSNVDTIQP